jgi:hypothetical protein
MAGYVLVRSEKWNATRSGLLIARLQNRNHIERLGQVRMSC